MKAFSNIPSLYTRCIHSGSIHDPVNQGVVSPLYPSTSNGYLGGEDDIYPRASTLPNQLAVAKKMGDLEMAESCLVLSSGMGAISTTLLAHLERGDHLVFQKNLYSVARNFIVHQLAAYGVEATETEGYEAEDFAACIRPHTKAIYFESPTNPLLAITDIEAVAGLAKERRLLTFFDNTFATSINQNPLTMGADVVFHSATKFLGGHGDLSAGVVAGSFDLMQPVFKLSRTLGGCLNAQMCHLLERSLQTLAIRIDRINTNALAIAEFLSGHPKIHKVYYPGLPSHEHHQVAKKQMRGFGGMLAFELDNSVDVVGFQRNLALIRSANSFGEVISSLNSPVLSASPTANLTPERMKRIGLTGQTIRMSAGIEGTEDLCRDLDQALNRF